jgi:hypothetical protein
MVTAAKPTRIVFSYRGKFYRFVNFFVDKHDNSFYFHIYRERGETLMSYDESRQENPLKIDFSLFKQTDFEENHFSFHESGVIHSKDYRGKRYRDGFIGIPFHDMKSFLPILVVAPKHPLKMTEIKSIDANRDIQIHLKDDEGPFAVHFAIVRNGTTLLPSIPPEADMLALLEDTIRTRHLV